MSKNSLFFPDGFFPSFRSWAGGLYKRADNTVFFTASVCFTLRRLLPLMDPEEQMTALEIIQSCTANFHLYRNKDGFQTYNFWQTTPSAHFPNGLIAGRFRFFQIPDDIDDTALVHLALQSNKAAVADALERLNNYAVGRANNRKLTIKGAENLKPFNTFCIKNMPNGVDVSALCNLLYLIYEYQFPATETIRDSELFIRIGIKEYFRKNPYLISPYYPDKYIIMYHLVRLIGDGYSHAFQELIPDLKPDCREMFDAATTDMQKLLASIALMRLTNTLTDWVPGQDLSGVNYPFFVAGLLGEMQQPWLRKMASGAWTHIRYTCEAYALVLMLEFLLVRRSIQMGAS